MLNHTTTEITLMTNSRIVSILTVTLLVAGAFVLYGCQDDSASFITASQQEPSPSLDVSNLFHIMDTYLGGERDRVLVFLHNHDSIEGWGTPNASGRLNDRIKFGQFVGEDALAIWGANAWRAALNKVPNNPDCRVKKRTWPGGDAEQAFAECLVGIAMGCSDGYHVFEINKEYHAYSNCG